MHVSVVYVNVLCMLRALVMGILVGYISVRHGPRIVHSPVQSLQSSGFVLDRVKV